MNYSIKITSITFLCVWLLISCADQAVEQDPEPEPDPSIDTISGVYFVDGSQSHWFWDCFNCKTDENPFKNGTEFSVNAQLVKDKVDTVRFYGLEGADAGIAEKKVFPNCTHPNDCRVYGRLHPSGEIEINIENDGRSYSALWSDNTLRGTFSHGEFSVKYDLSWKRVSF